MLQPGQYFLVQEAANAAVGSPLPTPDVAEQRRSRWPPSAGKVALANTGTALGCNGGSAPCTPAQLAQIIDLVGYGNANFFEGAGAAPTLTNTTAALRGASGCTDTDNNSTDFTAAVPDAPQHGNAAESVHRDVDAALNRRSASEGNAGTTSFNFTVSLSSRPAPEASRSTSAPADGGATAVSNDYVAQS